MSALLLFPFRFRDPLTGKWVRARYKAEPHEIAARYREWEITGPGLLLRSRDRSDNASSSWVRIAGNRPESTPGSANSSARSCRRLIVYEARKGRFDRVRGAVDLLAEVAGVMT